MSNALEGYTGEVCVYRNLTSGLWSATRVKGNDNRGLLLGHARELVLVGARSTVKPGARERARKGHREVYAWWTGKLADASTVNLSGAVKVTIHPKDLSCDGFYRVDTGADVTRADALRFAPSQECFGVGLT